MFIDNREVPTAGFCEHLEALSDDTGLLQHARFHLPNRDHGYCTDDNSRAAIVLLRLSRLRKLARSERAMLRNCLAFLDHALEETTGRFRNFMAYDRAWCDTTWFADPHGRAVWALGETIAHASGDAERYWAQNLLERVVQELANETAPRLWAFSLFGLEAALVVQPDWQAGLAARQALQMRLRQRWADAASDEWPWFEDTLAYDNARLCEAALLAGGDLAAAGLTALGALWDWQQEDGVFMPVGHDSFGRERSLPKRWDQQPLEAAAMLDACIRAHSVTGDDKWVHRARASLDWFHGTNALGLPLADPATGLCHDGLHPDRVNANAGAESTVSYMWARISAAYFAKGMAF